ncbi:MAG: hypothetical protein M1827_001351 [Pycnora praestabilis]|nr:MAG: hypothetical protein M1827_001351 [Pycnora praestabilis]
MDLPRFNPSSRPRQSELSHLFDQLYTEICSFFTGTSAVRSRSGSISASSPKTPRLGLPAMSSSRIDLPHLQRSPSPSRGLRSTAQSAIGYDALPPSHRVRAANTTESVQRSPRLPEQARPPSPTHFIAVDPAEQHLAALADDGRRQQHKRRRRTRRRELKPGRICFWTVKDPLIRRKIINCVVSGVVLATILTIYLAIALSNRIINQSFTIIPILLILVITIFFCHSLIRLIMLTLRASNSGQEDRVPSIVGPGGYAQPERPIRVVLARDEEAVLENDGAAGGEMSMKIESPPPAYGLWRCSVRVDPNLVHWQRAATPEALAENEELEGRPLAAYRPPSYISEDGIEYAVRAEPRSTVPS